MRLSLFILCLFLSLNSLFIFFRKRHIVKLCFQCEILLSTLVTNLVNITKQRIIFSLTFRFRVVFNSHIASITLSFLQQTNKQINFSSSSSSDHHHTKLYKYNRHMVESNSSIKSNRNK